MRLIDADELKIDYGFTWDDITPTHEEMYALIDRQPSIDAVPVIRCKDCKWWNKSEDSPFGYCMAMKHGYFSANWEIGIYRRYKGDFYCADAERKES